MSWGEMGAGALHVGPTGVSLVIVMTRSVNDVPGRRAEYEPTASLRSKEPRMILRLC
jgi:hypothetical protein